MNLRIERLVYGVLFSALLVTLASPHYVRAHNESFLSLYDRADAFTTQVKRFAIKHSLIGVKNTYQYTQQYSQELLSEINNNINELSHIVFGPAYNAYRSYQTLALYNNSEPDLAEQVIELSVNDIFADSHWLNQFAHSVEFTTTGQALAEEHFELHGAFASIIPNVRVASFISNDSLQRIDSGFDKVDLALHHFIVRDIMLSNNRVDRASTVVADNASEVIAMIDSSVIEPPLPVKFSSNGSFLQNNLVASHETEIEGRVLGDNTIEPWWQKALDLLLL